MTPIFITSLPLTVCGVKGESGFCQRLSVCMYTTAALYGKTEIYSHFSALTLANQNRRKVQKYGGGPKVNDGFLFLVLLSFHTGYIEVFIQGKCGRDTETTFELK